MHATYSSSIISLRTYSTFNDCFYYSNDRCPSIYCSCFCSFPVNSCKLIVPTNPSLLFGLRQSTLIQRPPSRRLFLGSSDRYVCRSSIYDVGRCCCLESCCVKQERVDRIVRRCKESCHVKGKSIDVNKIKGRIARPRVNLRSNALGDVDAMLSLLTEEPIEECVIVREKKRGIPQEGKVWSTKNVVAEKLRDGTENVDSGFRESESTSHQVKSGRVQYRDEGQKKKEERESMSKDEDQLLRRREFISSYYPLSDSGGFGSDVEVEVRRDRFLGESLSSYEKDSRKSGAVVINEDRKQNWERDKDQKHQELRSSTNDSYRVSGCIQRDWRKNSEKKLAEESEETKCRNDYAVRQSQLSQAKGSSSMMASSSKKQFNQQEERLTSDVRKSGGVVIYEDRKQNWERDKDQKHQELRSSTCDDYRVSGSIQRDWRKKSEKKLLEESEETKSRNDYVVGQSQLSQAKGSSSMTASSSKKQYNQQEERLTSDVKSPGQPSSRIQKENRDSNYSKSSRQQEHATTSTTWRRSSQGEDLTVVSESVQETGCDYCKTCGRSMEESKTQSDFQKRADQSEMSVVSKLTTTEKSSSENRHRKHKKSSISLQSSVEEESQQHDRIHMVTGQAGTNRKSQHYHEAVAIDNSCSESTLRATQVKQSEAQKRYTVEKSRTAESQSESRRTTEEKCSTSLQTSAKQESKRLDEIYLAIDQVDARRKSQHHSETMDTDASYLESISRSQQQSESRMKHLEGKTSSLIVAEEVKNPREKLGGKVTKDIAYSKVSTEIGNSRVHSSNLETNSQSSSDRRVYNEQTYSKSKVKSVEELVEKHKRIDETVVRSTHRTEVQGPSTGQFSRESIISQPSVPLISQTGVQKFSGEEVKGGQLSMTSPPYQYVNKRSEFRESSSSSVRNDMGRTMEVGSGGLQAHHRARTQLSYGEVDDSGRKSGEEYSPEDALVSAARMQESSALIVGEFVEKMSHQASTSETSTEKQASILNLMHYDKKSMLKGATQSDTNKTGLQKQSSDSSSRVSSPASAKKRLHKLYAKRSSVDSETKGPSDQMWDVKDHFVQEGSGMESSEGAAFESVGAVKTGKRLWNTVASIIRFRWGSHSESLKSPVKGQSSPSGSASGETWFSGNEADEENVDVMKEEHISSLQEPTSSDQSLLRTTRIQEDVGVMRLDEIMSHVDVGASSSLSALQGSSLLADAFVGENTNLNVAKPMPLPSPLKDLSIPSARQLRRSPAFEETDGAENYDSPISSSEEQRDVSVDGSPTDIPPSKGTDVEPKKKKLQRSRLVSQRFDEREDASSSLIVLQSSSLLADAFVGKNTNLNVAKTMSLPSPLKDISVPSAGQMRRSPAFEETDGAEKNDSPISSSEEQRGVSVDGSPTDVSPSEGTDVELKKKKLQRSKLVLQRFDEWEDAYRREREQRKVDEIFMREALSEAIKAADSWEVPVGAVLVQNRKIIARGYNLVEELRDSTAHAEMLCIREASNVLRTWRLSETTLYVTLEPCPMCAGAILQARISNLVWGAPNKLLGADGSWIRLFPEGEEGEERSEVTEKPAAPAHPFHPKMNIRRGILQEECADIMQQFFQLRRRKAKEKEMSSEEAGQPSCFPKPHNRPHHRSKLLHKMHNVFHPAKQTSD